MKKILVVYYSRTGYTRDLAGEIVATLRADVDQLDDRRDRCGILGYWRCAREALRKRTVELLPPVYDPSNYDVVVLGTPVWAGNMCSPLRSYVAAHAARMKQVAFFCTQGGSGADKVFRDLAQLCGKAPLATLTLTDRELIDRTFARKLENFTAAIKADKEHFRDSADQAAAVARPGPAA